jgi:predicted HD phosphohydrolase
MQKSDVLDLKEHLACNGSVFTDLGNLRVVARSLKRPAGTNGDGEHVTTVRVACDIEREFFNSRTQAVRRYLELVEHYG